LKGCKISYSQRFKQKTNKPVFNVFSSSLLSLKHQRSNQEHQCRHIFRVIFLYYVINANAIHTPIPDFIAPSGTAQILASKAASAAALPWIPHVLISTGSARRTSSLLLPPLRGASKSLSASGLLSITGSQDTLQTMQRASVLKAGLSSIAPQNQYSIFTPGSKIGMLISSGAKGEQFGSSMLQNSVSQSDWRIKSLHIASLPAMIRSNSVIATKGSKGSSVTPLPAVAGAFNPKQGQAVINSTEAVPAAACARVSPAGSKKLRAAGNGGMMGMYKQVSAIAEEEDTVAPSASVVKVQPMKVT
jgi:hypothetical protein